MHRREIIARFVCAIVFCTWVASAGADDLLNEALDANLASGDIRSVVAMLQKAEGSGDAESIRTWLKDKVDHGQAPDSWTKLLVVVLDKKGDRAEALFYLMYYRALLIVDAATCDDKSSGGSLVEQSMFLFPFVVRDHSVTEAMKRDAARRAFALEDTTSGSRTRDPSLCEAGISAYARALKVPMERSTAPARRLPSLYADDPVWREARSKIRPFLERGLLATSGVETGP